MKKLNKILLSSIAGIGAFILTKSVDENDDLEGGAFHGISFTPGYIGADNSIYSFEIFDDGNFNFTSGALMSGSNYNKKKTRFDNLISDTENLNGLPVNLLHRLLYQESHFREDVISCELSSPAGAKGIAQIVPRWHPDVNPCDPIASIKYAGKYLKTLFNKYGDWGLALAAYNWGLGNVDKALDVGTPFYEWPYETKNYVTDISSDLGLNTILS